MTKKYATESLQAIKISVLYSVNIIIVFSLLLSGLHVNIFLSMLSTTLVFGSSTTLLTILYIKKAKHNKKILPSFLVCTFILTIIQMSIIGYLVIKDNPNDGLFFGIIFVPIFCSLILFGMLLGIFLKNSDLIIKKKRIIYIITLSMIALLILSASSEIYENNKAKKYSQKITEERQNRDILFDEIAENGNLSECYDTSNRRTCIKNFALKNNLIGACDKLSGSYYDSCRNQFNISPIEYDTCKDFNCMSDALINCQQRSLDTESTEYYIVGEYLPEFCNIIITNKRTNSSRLCQLHNTEEINSSDILFCYKYNASKRFHYEYSYPCLDTDSCHSTRNAINSKCKERYGDDSFFCELTISDLSGASCDGNYCTLHKVFRLDDCHINAGKIIKKGSMYQCDYSLS